MTPEETAAILLRVEKRLDELRADMHRDTVAVEQRIHQRFDLQERAVQSALVAQEKAATAAAQVAREAISKADSATEKRFEGVNEFRQALSDQTARFIMRSEYTSAHEALMDRCTKLERAQSQQAGGEQRGDTTLTRMLQGLGILIALGLGVAGLFRH